MCTAGAAAPTSATTMKPTNAGVMPNETAAYCTDSTKISLTRATVTVITASITRKPGDVDLRQLPRQVSQRDIRALANDEATV